MKKITLLFMLFLATGFMWSQCTTGGAYQGVDLTNSGSFELQSGCNYTGEYSNTTSVIDGDTYAFASSEPTDFITVTSSDGAVVYGFGVTPLTLTIDTSADLNDQALRVYYHDDSGCGTTPQCRSTFIQNVTVAVDLCPEPVAFTATNVTESTADLSWGEAGVSAVSYNVEVYASGESAANGDAPVFNAAAVTGFSVLASGLAETTVYDAYIMTNCSGATAMSALVGPQSFTTSSLCDDVSGLAIDNIGADQADVLFTPGNGNDVFLVEVYASGENAANGDTPVYANAAVASSPETATGLSALTAYDVYVTGSCGAAPTTTQGPVGFSTVATPPANDTFATATPIVPSPQGTGCSSFNFINSDGADGTTDSGLDGTCNGGSTGLDRFYTWTATTEALLWNDGDGNPGIVIRDAVTQAEITCSGTFAGPDTVLSGWTLGQDVVIQVYDFNTADVATSFCLELFACFPPTAIASAIDDCTNNQFSIDVDITDLGNSTSLTIAYDDGSGPQTTVVSNTGVENIGPFSVGADVIILLIHENDAACNVDLGVYNSGCPIFNTIDCASGVPLNIEFCYDNSENIQYSFTSSDGALLQVDFIAGYFEDGFDDITIYDGLTTSDPVLFVSDTNFGDDATGISATSTGDSILVQLVSDGSVSCASGSGSGIPLNFDVTCVVPCTADAGTLTADEGSVFLAGGTATISASEGTAPTIPTGYTSLYVLTSGAGLVIEQAGAVASFDVASSGDYTIHTLVYDPNTLDPASLPAGATGFDVNALLIQGGGAICGALDVTGAAITVEDCTADAGTLTADEGSVFLAGGTATISASIDTAPTIPTGYTSLYVLTSGAGLVIEQAGAAASFNVTSSGDYTIHTLVYDPNTLDPASLPAGATGFDVNAVLIQGGGAICGALDVTGAAITVEDCTADAGTLIADASPVELVGGTATISASIDTAPTVPAGYTSLYVLTAGAGLVIEQAGAAASFDVTSIGNYTIHTLVYDPNTLDPASLPAGATGFDVNALLIQGGGAICGALDVTGAAIIVEDVLGVNDLDETSFEYYPNPVQQALTLNAQNTIENVTIYNMLGQEVLRVNPNTIESTIDMSNLQTGFYFVKVTISNVTQTIRVLKK